MCCTCVNASPNVSPLHNDSLPTTWRKRSDRWRDVSSRLPVKKQYEKCEDTTTFSCTPHVHTQPLLSYNMLTCSVIDTGKLHRQQQRLIHQATLTNMCTPWVHSAQAAGDIIVWLWGFMETRGSQGSWVIGTTPAPSNLQPCGHGTSHSAELQLVSSFFVYLHPFTSLFRARFMPAVQHNQ